jgi:lipopolysaccharide/colanic/teichoic acid biosynthesis glycosyltransferase
MNSQETSPRPRHRLATITQCPVNTPQWKRTMDVLFILLAAPAVLPIGLLIAAYIRLVSRGPIFFKQERVGFKGTTFLCYKFRSMKVNAETSTHQNYTAHLIKKSDVPMVKMDSKGDKRLIPFGSLLRATGLDELPQLINVWRGEMSLVGPRPCTGYEYDQYLPWQKERFNVVPGLTGLWQVSGKNHTTFNEMIHLDIAYGKLQSPWMDMKIILKTFPALFDQVSGSKMTVRNSVAPKTSKASMEAMAGDATRNLASQ